MRVFTPPLHPSPQTRHAPTCDTRRPSDPPRARLAAVHRFHARSGHRPMQGRHRRLVPGTERPAQGGARRVAGADHTELAAYKAAHPNDKVAPFAVNQIVHASNDRLLHDMEVCVRFKVPIIITSLRPPGEIIEAAHSYGGIVLHDVINVRHARKAAEAGVDGLILVCTGAGDTRGRCRRSHCCRKCANFSTRPSCLPAPSPMARRCSQRRAMGAISPTWVTRFVAVKGGERERRIQTDDHQVGRRRPSSTPRCFPASTATTSKHSVLATASTRTTCRRRTRTR